jgi:hypothetical protein
MWMMLNLHLYDALMMSKILVRLVYSKHLTRKDAAGARLFGIQSAMTNRLWTPVWMLIGTTALIGGSATAQDTAPAASPAITLDNSPANSETTIRQQTAAPEGLAPSELPGGKIGLVRGVVKRNDAVHDELLIHAFGGRDIRIAFDPRTKLLPESASGHLTSIPVGSVVSVDTVIDHGRLFARSVRTGASGSSAVELSGKVMRYDAASSRLVLRDPISPEDVSLRVTASTVVVNQGKAASAQALAPGMLVRVQFSAAKNTANNIEILATRGDSFAFEGKILSVDLRSRVVSLSNNTDQSVRELAIGSLDSASLGLLREGADVDIQAEFDGDRYNVRTVRLAMQNQ